MYRTIIRLGTVIGLMLVVLNPITAQQIINSSKNKNKPLDKTVLVSGNWTYTEKKVSIGGRLFDAYGSWGTIGSEGTISFDVRGYDTFVTTIGIRDDMKSNIEHVVTLLIDGQQVWKKQLDVGVAEDVQVPVKGKRSLAIIIETPGFHGLESIVFGEPKLLNGSPSPSPTSTSTGPIVDSPNVTTLSATFVVDPNDLDKLAIALRKQVDAKPEIKAKVEKSQMAIMTFNLIDIPSQSVAANVAEDLTTSLMKSDFQTVERGQLDKVLKELKVQDSGLINPSTAQKIGQVTGCNIIMVGSISDRGQFIVINARMLDTATGKTIAAERVECRKIEIKR